MMLSVYINANENINQFKRMCNLKKIHIRAAILRKLKQLQKPNNFMELMAFLQHLKIKILALLRRHHKNVRYTNNKTK